ncbi:MAG: putative sugar nucleotidyl transferase [Candidatus Zhuqueibacterota bacterium]
MNFVLYEDSKYENLVPIVFLRPVYELKCGHTLLREKIERMVGRTCDLFFMRDYLAPVFSKKFGVDKVNQIQALKGDDALLVNGRLLAIETSLNVDGPEEIAFSGEQIVFARLKKATIAALAFNTPEELLNQVADLLPKRQIEATMINFPWNLVQNNSRAIVNDFDHLPQKGIHGNLSPQAAIIGNKDLIYMAPGSVVHPFAVLDASRGPILFDKNVVIHPYTHIEGPNSIGEKSQAFGGNIREGCSIGPVCRVHGEIEESIIHGYSNKHHDGFLGHAYVGEWVNLGAFTTNSDLKNDYTTVQLYLNGELVDSGDMKVGSFIGDHTKTSIGTLLSTGSMVGIMSNIIHAGELTKKYVPSFTWFLNNRATKGFGFHHMISTAARAMERRGVTLTAEDEKMLETVFEMTQADRKYWIKKGFQS